MSVLGINKFTRDLEHDADTIAAYKADPDNVLDRYRLSDEERSAIRRLDATDLLQRDVNPIVIRNLLVILGIKHGEMYTHEAV